MESRRFSRTMAFWKRRMKGDKGIREKQPVKWDKYYLKKRRKTAAELGRKNRSCQSKGKKTENRISDRWMLFCLKYGDCLYMRGEK